jgi:hypothetical protein
MARQSYIVCREARYGVTRSETMARRRKLGCKIAPLARLFGGPVPGGGGAPGGPRGGPAVRRWRTFGQGVGRLLAIALTLCKSAGTLKSVWVGHLSIGVLPTTRSLWS